MPTVRQLQSMLEAGYKFEATILVTSSRKPRNSNGKELPDDLSDPENRGNYFMIRNPACQDKEPACPDEEPVLSVTDQSRLSHQELTVSNNQLVNQNLTTLCETKEN